MRAGADSSPTAACRCGRLARLLRRRRRAAGCRIPRSRADPTPPSRLAELAGGESTLLARLALVDQDGPPTRPSRPRCAAQSRNPDAFLARPAAAAPRRTPRSRRGRRARLHDRGRTRRRPAGLPAHPAVAHRRRRHQRGRPQAPDRSGGRRLPGRARGPRRVRRGAGLLAAASASGSSRAPSGGSSRRRRSAGSDRRGLPRGAAARAAHARRRLLPAAAWPSAYPLDPDWPARAARLRRIAELWGFVDPDGSEPPWVAPLRRGGAADPRHWPPTSPPRSIASTCRPI